ncbi:TPA: ATP-binding protein [Legionella pneumophila]|nr:ATP-binding protein [Legionella pneumophila]HBC0467285.1 ATP-binding protein [Legionella pneumophila]
MLIEFKVKNFRSLYHQQIFSMVASANSEIEDNVCTTDCHEKFRVVRAAVFYGANASGKSNILSALLFMRMFIIHSAKESQHGEKISVDSFMFSNNETKQPSEFEIIFIKNKIRYQYGFVVDENKIYEEWLFAYPLGKAQRWFSRIYDQTNKVYDWKFSKYFKGYKQIRNLTRSNVLFLSNAVQLNNEQLTPVFGWFQKDLVFIDPPRERGVNIRTTIELLKTSEGAKRVLTFMKTADPSISDIQLKIKKPKEEEIYFSDTMPAEVQNYFKKEIVNKEQPIIKFIHNQISLPLYEESEGTRRLLSYAGRWIDAIDNGKIIIVDELDNSLHPLVVKFLIKLICNPEINKNNAQLIFSTHDTSLLDNDLFRRDQIWFVEKDEENSSQLYPLLDFSPRKHEAFGKGYLQGRYGALPFIGEWKF